MNIYVAQKQLIETNNQLVIQQIIDQHILQ